MKTRNCLPTLLALLFVLGHLPAQAAEPLFGDECGESLPHAGAVSHPRGGPNNPGPADEGGVLNTTDEPCHSINLAEANSFSSCFGDEDGDTWGTVSDGRPGQPAAKASATCPDGPSISCSGVEATAERQFVSCQKADGTVKIRFCSVGHA